MKEIIFAIIFCIHSGIARSQVSIEIGAGASTQRYAVAELATGYNFGAAFIRAGYIASLTRNVDGGTYFNAMAGRQIQISENWFAEPALGYAYILRSVDKPDMNGNRVMYSLGFGKDVNDASVILKATYIDKTAFASIAMRYNF